MENWDVTAVLLMVTGTIQSVCITGGKSKFLTNYEIESYPPLFNFCSSVSFLYFYNFPFPLYATLRDNRSSPVCYPFVTQRCCEMDLWVLKPFLTRLRHYYYVALEAYFCRKWLCTEKGDYHKLFAFLAVRQREDGTLSFSTRKSETEAVTVIG